MDNVVVTGGFGFVGSHVTKELLKQRKKVTVIDNLSSVNPAMAHFVDHLARNGANLPIEAARISFYKADMRNPKEINDIFEQEKFDTCIHLAAKVSVSESITNPKETLMTNIDGTLNTIDACAKTKVKNFVLASTGAVYGEPMAFPISEDHVLNPLSIYAATKIAAESLLAAYVNTKKLKNGISLRFFNIYGNGQNPQYAGVITNFSNRISHGLAPVIYGNGEQTRDFIFINDVVRAIMVATNFGIERSEYNIFNIASGISITINELAYAMIDFFKLDLKPIYQDERIGDVKKALVDISRARQILEFVPQTNLLTNLIEMSRQTNARPMEMINDLPEVPSSKMTNN
jgi:UDP-glucose 4-epimerase